VLDRSKRTEELNVRSHTWGSSSKPGYGLGEREGGVAARGDDSDPPWNAFVSNNSFLLAWVGREKHLSLVRF